MGLRRFGGSAFDVGEGGLAESHADHDGAIDRGVELAAASVVDSVTPAGLARVGRDRADPAQQIRCRPRRQHACLDEAGKRGGHLQHRGCSGLVMTQRQILVRKPEIALDLKPGRVHEPIRRIRHRILRSKLGNLRTKQRRGPGPAHPLGDGRCRHRRRRREQHPHPTRQRVETRPCRRPLIRRCPVHGQHPINRPPRHPDQSGYLPL